MTSGEVPDTAAAENSDDDGKTYTLDRSKAGSAMPDFVFAAPDGSDTRLTDFQGKPVVVNLWATWCAPCVAEMPTLDDLASQYKGKVTILTISQDSQGKDLVDPFFKGKNFKNLQAWLDPENQFGFHYNTGMLPTTVLYDAQGKEVARVVGAMDWDSADGRKLVEEALSAA